MELKKADSGVYYIHWTENRRSKRVSTRQSDLAKAKAFMAEWLLMEHSAPADANGLTVAELWRLYETKHVDVEMAAPVTAKMAWKNLGVHFGHMLPGEINQDVVDGYEAKRVAGKIGKPSKASTVRRELVALQACLNWSASPKRKILHPSSVPVFDLPDHGAPRDRWLGAEEAKLLLDTAASMRPGHRLTRIELFLWLALETAARRQAIIDLTWDRVDLETRMIHYNVPGRRVTKKRRTSVPISDRLFPVLVKAQGECTNELVLGNKGNVWAGVKRVADAAGLKDVSPHVLRHTAATHMARRGVPLFHVAGVLGNSVAMVEKVYAKHSPGALAAAVNQISG